MHLFYLLCDLILLDIIKLNINDTLTLAQNLMAQPIIAQDYAAGQKDKNFFVQDIVSTQ